MKLSELPKREALRERAYFNYPQSKIPECPGYREVRGASSALRQHSGFLCPEGAMSEIPKGFCQCGCGGRTNITSKTCTRTGAIKGEPLRFIHGHHNMRGDKSYNWKGGTTRSHGYLKRLKPDYHRSDSKGYVPEHIFLAENALGKPLPEKAVVHHHTQEQLVICQDQAYHLFIHQRKRAYDACGHANWRKCTICKLHDDPIQLSIGKQGQACHPECRRFYRVNGKQ